MAKRDEEGYYYLVDRKANMIITGGENVYPSEVENVLITHEAVRDVAVIGVPDKKWGEAVKAIIVLKKGYEPSEALAKNLIDFSRGKIAGYNMAGKSHKLAGEVAYNVLPVFEHTAAFLERRDDGDDQTEVLTYMNQRKSIYRKILIKNNRIVGAVMLGAYQDAETDP